MKVINLLNMKGGVAKSFTAVNMAYELWRRGYGRTGGSGRYSAGNLYKRHIHINQQYRQQLPDREPYLRHFREPVREHHPYKGRYLRHIEQCTADHAE